MEEIKYNGQGERIDRRLTNQFPYSRNFFHHILSRGGIKVNEKVVKKSYKLKHNDIIFIDDLQRYLSPIILEEAPNIDIPVKLETEDYMVINKPKGVLSHPNSVWDISTPSVVGFLYHRFKGLPTVGNFIRSGLIHRLDKDTDGLMIVVKTEVGLSYFKKLFQEKSNANTIEQKEKVPLKKIYRAECIITPKGKEFLTYIGSQLPYYIKEDVVAKVPYTVPKLGISKIIDISPNKDKVLVYIEILTGRTHQIRFHLSNHGLPIIGDYLYGIENNEGMKLTAYRLSFRDNLGKDVEIEI